MTKTLTITANGRTTRVMLDRGTGWVVGERYSCPTRRMKDALRRVGASEITEVAHDAAEAWSYFGGYFVSFEPKRA